MNNSHMSNLTENYSRTARVLHLQAISFRIVSIEPNSQLQVRASETAQLKAVSDIASVFPCFNPAIPVQFGNSYSEGWEKIPTEEELLHNMCLTQQPPSLSVQSLTDDQGHRGGSNQEELEEKDPEGVLEKGN